MKVVALARGELRPMVEGQVRLAMSCVVTLALLTSGLLVLLAGIGAADLQRAAGGWIGFVAGNWVD